MLLYFLLSRLDWRDCDLPSIDCWWGMAASYFGDVVGVAFTEKSCANYESDDRIYDDKEELERL